jgi:hypothetical protein
MDRPIWNGSQDWTKMDEVTKQRYKKHMSDLDTWERNEFNKRQEWAQNNPNWKQDAEAFQRSNPNDQLDFLRQKKILEQKAVEDQAQKELRQRMFEDFRAEKFGGLSDIEKARILKDPMARAQFDHNSKVEMFADRLRQLYDAKTNESDQNHHQAVKSWEDFINSQPDSPNKENIREAGRPVQQPNETFESFKARADANRMYKPGSISEKFADALSPQAPQAQQVEAKPIDQIKGGLGDALMLIGLQKALDIPEAGAGSDIVPGRNQGRSPQSERLPDGRILPDGYGRSVVGGREIITPPSSQPQPNPMAQAPSDEMSPAERQDLIDVFSRPLLKNSLTGAAPSDSDIRRRTVINMEPIDL